MTVRVDTSSLIAGKCVVGNRGLGLKGSVIRANTAGGTDGAGYLYNDLTAADDNKEIRGLIVTPPASGTFIANEDGSFTLTGVTAGTYSFTYRLFVDGVDSGTATATITLGPLSAATGTGAVVSSGAAVGGSGITAAAGTIAGVGAVTAAGGTVAGSGSAALAGLTGTGAVVASGGQVAGSGSIGAAPLTGTGNVVAAGGTTSGSGSVSGGGNGGIADPGDVWQYVMPNGQTAAQMLQETHDYVLALARLHGLVKGETLRVASTYRIAGPIQQTISEAGDEVTVTRTV